MGVLVNRFNCLAGKSWAYSHKCDKPAGVQRHLGGLKFLISIFKVNFSPAGSVGRVNLK